MPPGKQPARAKELIERATNPGAASCNRAGLRNRRHGGFYNNQDASLGTGHVVRIGGAQPSFPVSGRAPKAVSSLELRHLTLLAVWRRATSPSGRATPDDEDPLMEPAPLI